MKTRSLALLALALVATAFAADKKDEKSDKVKSDLVPPDKRRASVELGQRLTRPPTPEPLPADLAQPFNPPGFDLPDRNEAQPVPPPSVAGGAGAGGAAAPAPPGPVPGEREKLDTLAAKLAPTGSIKFGNNYLLSFGTKNVRVGADFEVSTNGQVYVLKLVAVDSLTFTVRLGNEEVTRSIDPKRK